VALLLAAISSLASVEERLSAWGSDCEGDEHDGMIDRVGALLGAHAHDLRQHSASNFMCMYNDGPTRKASYADDLDEV